MRYAVLLLPVLFSACSSTPSKEAPKAPEPSKPAPKGKGPAKPADNSKKPGWDYREIDTKHMAMLTAPRAVMEVLLDCAK